MHYKNFNLLKGNTLPLVSFILGIIFLVLLIYFLKPTTVLEVLNKITLWQLGLILTLKLVFSIFGAWKWKIILEFYNQKIPPPKLYLFKIATFSVSYFTPMAAVGGQAVGVMLLKNEKVPTKIGIMTMLIDSVLTPFISIIISFLAVLIFLVTKFSSASFLIFGLLTLFLIVLFSIYFLIVLKIKRTTVQKPKHNFWLRWKITIKDFLFAFADFFRKNKKATLYLIALSLLGHAATLFEIFLILSFLGVSLAVIELAIIEVGYTFAFIIPISQALGTAEVSGAYFLNLLGYSATLGVSLTLILRFRHLLVAAIGIAVLIFYGVIKLRLPKAL